MKVTRIYAFRFFRGLMFLSYLQTFSFQPSLSFLFSPLYGPSFPSFNHCNPRFPIVSPCFLLFLSLLIFSFRSISDFMLFIWLPRSLIRGFYGLLFLWLARVSIFDCFSWIMISSEAYISFFLGLEMVHVISCLAIPRYVNAYLPKPMCSMGLELYNHALVY